MKQTAAREKESHREGSTLSKKNAIATVAVKNIKIAENFYEGKLGLTPTESEEASVVVYKAGHSTLFVYESQFAGSNKATAVTWDVGDELEEIVRTLKSKGVVFEHYDLPNSSRSGDIHSGGSAKIAWFKDPDGNIHGLVSR